MLDKLHVELKNKKGAFSVAEMLMVLLILSFLILALPPIVHKKVEKRIIRGEHGRYECWIDPNNGQTYEYYATEKNGIAPGYTATGKVVDACRFSPKEQAPNAAYFSFQAIGGGAGGTYPPYDPNNTTYRDEDYTEKATVSLSTDCCNSYSTSSSSGRCYSTEGRDTYNYKFKVGSHEYEGKKSCDDHTSDTLGRYCYHYAGSIHYYRNQPSTKNWIDLYWVPVPGTGKVKICSGRGYTGVPELGLTQFDDGTEKRLYRYHYGGMYGLGACWERDASTLYLDNNNRYKIVYATRSDVDSKYFYGYEEGSSDDEIITSWEFKPADYDYGVYGPDWTTPNPPVELPARYGNYQEPAPNKGGNATCGEKYYGNYVKAFMDGGSYPDTCLVGPGQNGVKANPDSEMPNAEYQSSPFTHGGPSPTTCDAPWVQLSETNSSISTTISRPSWPSSITIKRQYGYDTPTMGYAGTPGQSVGMFLPKLMEDLTFEIGSAGAPGQPGSKTGGNGGDTIVRAGGTVILTAKGGVAKAGGERGNKVFMFGRDAMFGRAAVDRIPEVPGVSEAVPGRPAVVGACSGLGLDPSGPGQIDGCLDKTVARDNPKRFAVDSEFYTILELDTNSRTPSAIYRLYGAEGTGIMPGTAGDGGYSFLRSTSGREALTYTNHPTAQDWVQDYEYEYTGPYTCYKRDDNFGHPTGEVVNSPDTVCKPTRGYPGAVVIVW